MEAAVVVVPPAVATDVAGSAAGSCAPASGHAPARPFGAVLQQKVNGQQAADETRAEPERQDGENHAAEPDKEVGEAGSSEAQELVVQGGINIALPGSSGQSGASSAGQSGDGVAQAVVEMTGGLVPAESQAAEAGFPAGPAASQVAGDAEAKLAAMQAKVQGTQPQVAAAEGSTEPAGEAQVKGGAQQSSPTGPGSVQADENLNLTQAPDRGAAVEAAVMSSAAVAKEEAGQKAAAEVGRGKFEVINPEAATEEAAATAATEKSKGKDAGQPAAAVKSQEALPEKAAEMRPVQSSSQTGTEHSQPPLAAAAPDRAGAGLESVPARETADAGKAAEPPVSRQQIMDQVVRSARLNLERGMSRFEMRLEPPSLGKLGVVMDLKDGALSITFRAESPAVREALQSSLPQLREALAGQGLNIEGFDVQGSGRGAHGQDDARQEQGFEQWSGGSRSQEADGRPAGFEAVRAGNGLLDCWA